ncbi:uncharacterized protein LOC143370012 [Andrena cerasifolii]|uniref:uncharacterized protein LOC143370012 n=1 Tax=Andrena cerasifolii TaxID=2819439 RepID=UPI0040382A0D
MVGSMVTLVIPSVLQFYVSISDKNLDGAIETLPHLVTLCIALIKLLSMHFNRENFRKVFLTVESDWENPVFTKDMDILEEITGKGGRLAYMYRTFMLSFFGSFVTLPLCNPMLDIIMPLNETRGRKELFSLYYFVNNNDHFYTIYVHSVWCGLVTMVTIVTVDSVNMIITHHASALFAICGFFDFLDGTNRMTFLLQVGFNMVGTSVTAFQAVMHLDDTKEAVRYAIFFGGQKFHLYFLSLPGQILSEYSTEVLDHMYVCNYLTEERGAVFTSYGNNYNRSKCNSWRIL